MKTIIIQHEVAADGSGWKRIGAPIWQPGFANVDEYLDFLRQIGYHITPEPGLMGSLPVYKLDWRETSQTFALTYIDFDDKGVVVPAKSTAEVMDELNNTPNNDVAIEGDVEQVRAPYYPIGVTRP